nr:hypothetical protein [Tanacetum cinerariifolium]
MLQFDAHYQVVSFKLRFDNLFGSANLEDEEDASDFEPQENGANEDTEYEEEDDGGGVDGWKVEAPPKRKRSEKDGSYTTMMMVVML